MPEITQSRTLILTTPDGLGGIQGYARTLERACRDSAGPTLARTLKVPSISPLGKALFTLKAIYLAIAWRPRIVISNHLALAPVTNLVRALSGARLWQVAHGTEVWGKISPSQRRTLRASNGILAVSEFTATRIVERHGVERHKIHIQPGTFDRLPAQAENDGPPTPSSVILTVGRMDASERYKGQELVIRALPQLLEAHPDARYVLVGSGDDVDRLRALAAELGVEEAVDFKGAVSDSELAGLYRRCAVFALPAQTVLDDDNPKGEGFGIVFLEAMSLGKPVIGPNRGAPAEFITDGVHGLLVDPSDASALARALERILSNPDEARRMGREGQREALENHSYERFVERLQVVYAAGEAITHSGSERG